MSDSSNADDRSRASVSQTLIAVRHSLREEPQLWLQRDARNRWFCPHCGEIINSIVLPPGAALALLPDLPHLIIEHLRTCSAVQAGIPPQKRLHGADAASSGLHQAMHDARMRQRHTLRGPPPVAGFEIGCLFRPMEAVGGDFYEFLALADGKLGIGIGDASGHGVEACMLTAVTKKVLNLVGRGGCSPRECLSAVNREIHEDVMQGVFISAGYAILEPGTRQLTYARAGHPPPIIFNPSGEPEALHLPSNGLALGVDRGPRFEQVIEEKQITLHDGDLLVFYTDGLIELPVPEPGSGDIGVDGFIYMLRKYYDRPLDDMISQIWHRAERLFRKKGQPDDITMVAVRVVK
jgi:sigma-B regulation protein RsbU (phosphoserine phosphatase)